MEIKHIELASRLAGLGLTDEEIIFALNTTQKNYDALLKLKDFSSAVNSSRDNSTRKVEESLLKRACGYEYEQEKYYKVKKKLVKRNVKVHVPPDITAARFWLLNKRADVWKLKPVIEEDMNYEVRMFGED